MPYADTKQIKIYYELAGRGPRLLFIGGVGGDLRSHPNAFDSPLKEHFELLAFDQRGTGRTAKPDQQYSLQDYVQDTIALLDNCHWDKSHVVGVSFGGMVAQELAIQHPERVQGLVLACTTAGGAGGSSYPLHELSDLPAEQRARLMLGIADTRKGPAWQAENPERTLELIRQGAENAAPFLSEPGGIAGIRRQIQARRHHDTYNRLHRISAPTLVCAGKFDGQAKFEAVNRLHERIPEAKLKVFQGGHAFLNQDPEAYLEIIKFLTSRA
ncbi:alpha/beta fold hydrolase [Sedimenticola hydrogenitrophicus]|uniref:alpha/beta fold hydrolase n=1 Tax=Sedimenticola hydrogenitrophicus TaxID=2967975 RepID=UPI0023AF6FCE|nr:alpha/beta hydrolase [Sedimenticola hydrogenitrophicus]